MTGTGQIRMPDNFQLQLGTSADMEIYHNGTNTIFDNQTGNLIIQNNSDDKDIIFQSDDGAGGLAEYLRLDGGIASLVASKDLLMSIIAVPIVIYKTLEPVLYIYKQMVRLYTFKIQMVTLWLSLPMVVVVF